MVDYLSQPQSLYYYRVLSFVITRFYSVIQSVLLTQVFAFIDFVYTVIGSCLGYGLGLPGTAPWGRARARAGSAGPGTGPGRPGQASRPEPARAGGDQGAQGSGLRAVRVSCAR